MYARWLCGVLAVWGIVVGYSEPPAPEVEAPIRRVVVFRNGYAMTFREATFTAEGDRVVLKNSARPIFGAVWGYATDPKVRVISIHAVKRKESQTVQSLAELLLLNDGAQVEVTLNAIRDPDPRHYGYSPALFPAEERTYRGKLMVMKPILDSELVRSLSRRGAPRDYPYLPRTREDETSALAQAAQFAVETPDGIVPFHPSQVARVRFLGDYKRTREVSLPETNIEIMLDGVRKGQKITVGIACIEQGIGWLPAYELLLDSPKQGEATLTLRGTVVNQLEDLNDAELLLAVGTPHFLLRQMDDPLNLNADYWQILTWFGDDRQRYYPDYFGYPFRGTFGGFGGFGGSPGTAPTTPTAPASPPGMGLSVVQLQERPVWIFPVLEEGVGVVHLFKLPRVRNISLQQSASFTVETFTVPYETVYLWTYAARVPESLRWQWGRNPRLETSSQLRQVYTIPELAGAIWKAARIANPAQFPLPSGSVLVRRDMAVIGQDTLPFAPAGGAVEVRLEPDDQLTYLVVQDRETDQTEIRQKLRLVSTRDRGWWQDDSRLEMMTIQIRLQSRHPQPIKLVIHYEVYGEFLQVPGGATVRALMRSEAPHLLSIMRWETTVPPEGTGFTLTYFCPAQ